MLSIVLTYFQRGKQLLKTLDSFRQYDYDFNVIIVDDNSPDKLVIPENKYPFETTVITLTKKQWINPGPTFNVGFNHALKANPDIVLIQNAECYHVGDIVGYAIKNVSKTNYITFGCYSLSSDQDVNLKDLNNRGAVSNGDSAWYNHSKYRPEALHFCAAISTDNLRKINGFDERLAMGLGYEDNLFIHNVRMLGLKVEIVDNPFVFHQYHYEVKAFTFNQELYNQTAAICKQIQSLRQFRAEHLITPDL